ncbi:hypothetical protein [Pseudomonas mandelii]|uniref:hypothetical protein n=1 Tax=Pseudomonas mandelii TaxID=75612 RepID=UPI00224AA43A|nr:hypothetical protein [Pseudomonas mandelii]MCX2897878.1 hypothetical protein [Pseudomonas mandelii]
MQFYIYKIKIDAESKRIVAVFTCGQDEDQWCWVPTEFVIQLINKGVQFNTLFKVGEANYQKGARVAVGDDSFLRTVGDGQAGEGLDRLPTVVV